MDGSRQPFLRTCRRTAARQKAEWKRARPRATLVARDRLLDPVFRPSEPLGGVLRIVDDAGEQHGAVLRVDDEADERTVDLHLEGHAHALDTDLDGGDGGRFGAFLGHLADGLVLHVLDEDGARTDAGEVGAARVEGLVHAQRAQAVLERSIVVDLEAGQPQLTLALVGHRDELVEVLVAQVVDHVFHGLAVGGQQDDHAHRLRVAEGQRHRVEVAEPAGSDVGEVAVAVHQRVLLRATGGGEGVVGGERLVELGRPLAFEVHGVEQEHDRVGVDALDDRVDLLAGVRLDPGVDGVDRGRVIEVERFDGGAEELLVGVEEGSVEADAFARVDGVGDLELHAETLTLQGGEEVGVREVVGVRVGSRQTEGLDETVQGFAPRAIGRHAERQGHAERRHENVLAGVGGQLLAKQSDAEAGGGGEQFGCHCYSSPGQGAVL